LRFSFFDNPLTRRELRFHGCKALLFLQLMVSPQTRFKIEAGMSGAGETPFVAAPFGRLTIANDNRSMILCIYV
jgi:hypothetical protein